MKAKEQRHQIMIEALREQGRIDVSQLKDSLGVTEMTIRRDLEVLEADGALKRVHGGAILPVGSSFEPPFASRRKSNVQSKIAIAHTVSESIADGETVLLDGGSTGLAIANALYDRVLTVCPLSLRVAAALAGSTTISLRMPGGAVRAGEQSFIGSDVLDYLDRHHFDHYIMTASGMSIANGFTEWNPEDAAIKRKALTVSEQTIAAADSSKFGQTGFVKICALSAPTLVVTDALISDDEFDALLASNPHSVQAS